MAAAVVVLELLPMPVLVVLVLVPVLLFLVNWLGHRIAIPVPILSHCRSEPHARWTKALEKCYYSFLPSYSSLLGILLEWDIQDLDWG